MSGKKVMLVIMDGWGKGLGDATDAVSKAQTPFINECYKKYSNAELITHSQSVGLPAGQMGNSEVGHLNIGAGRIVYQDLLRIDNAIADASFEQMTALHNIIEYCKNKKCNLHIMGLVSDGGVHSSMEHLKAICKIFIKQNLPNVYIHAFTDGRDTDPKSGYGFIKEVLETIDNSSIKLATVTGRYYAMDRDKRWNRVKVAYDAMVKGMGVKSDNILESIKTYYNENITDEFFPAMINESGYQSILPGDAVLCFNFRTDRCREITEVLTQQNFPEFDMQTLPLYYTTMTNYDASYKNIEIIFDKDNLKNTLGETVANAGKNQIRMAETEKYPHVTFFFNGGYETPFLNEKRIMAPSPKVATYDLQPEMSAVPLTNFLLDELATDWADLVVINYANADMVGHTGDFEAVKKAVNTVDTCVAKIVTAALDKDFVCLVTADHGNADYMVNADGSPNTAHTKNPVPIFCIDKNHEYEIENGKLADIAPSILSLMEIPIPADMTGNILIKKIKN